MEMEMVIEIEMEQQEKYDEDGGRKVRELIDMATESTASEVDPRLLKPIKSLLRSSDSHIQIAHETLICTMKTQHSQVRYLALVIIDQLFMRSKLFRSLLVAKFDQFLSLSVGFRRNHPLPNPPSIATRLRAKSIEFLEKWYYTFGVHYRQLRLGFNYLKNTLRMRFPNTQQNLVRLELERRQREMRSKEILRDKFENLRINISSIRSQIQSTVNEVSECLEIMCFKKHEMFRDIRAEEDEVEEFAQSSSALKQIRLVSLEEEGRIRESNENKGIMDTLMELYKLLVNKHLVTVQEWMDVLVRVDSEDTCFRDRTLKEFIDVRNRIQSLKQMCEQSGCSLTNAVTDQEEDGDFWVEGEIEPFNGVVKPGEVLPNTVIVEEENNKIPCKARTSSENREKLKGLVRSWGRVDCDRVIPAAETAELNVKENQYKDENVNIRTCPAPSRRAAEGPSTDLPPPRHMTAEELAKQAVKNVRERDRDEANKEKNSKLRLKRAKVTEHNNVCLRDSGIASTSGSAFLGEGTKGVTFGNGRKHNRKNQLQALAAMLHEKGTTKDRITVRLMNR